MPWELDKYFPSADLTLAQYHLYMEWLSFEECGDVICRRSMTTGDATDATSVFPSTIGRLAAYHRRILKFRPTLQGTPSLRKSVGFWLICLSFKDSPNAMSIRETHVAELWIIRTFFFFKLIDSRTHFWRKTSAKCYAVIVYFIKPKSNAGLPHT